MNANISSEIPLLLSVNELSSVLRISKSSAYRLIRSKEIKSIHVGNSIRIPKKALEQYLIENGISEY